MKKLITLAFAALLVVACSKDQQASRNLDGTWKWVEINDLPVDDDLDVKITFEKGKDGEGTGTSVITQGSDSFSTQFTYKVRGDELITEDSGEVDSSIIITLNKDVLKLNDGDDSYTYTKQ